MMRAAAALLFLVASTPLGTSQDKQDELEKRRDAVAAKLESLRGLKFKTPLAIREGTRKEYAVFVLENARRVYGDDLAAADKGLKAMGLLPQKMRLELAITAQAGFGVKLW